MASGVPEAAICVQDLDVQCVLQFTLINAAGCALHRRTNRVIHRQECFQRSSSFPETCSRAAAAMQQQNGRTQFKFNTFSVRKVSGKTTLGRPPLVGGRDERLCGSLNLAEATTFDAAGHRMPDDDRRTPVLTPSIPGGNERDRYPRRRHRYVPAERFISVGDPRRRSAFGRLRLSTAAVAALSGRDACCGRSIPV